MKIILTRRFKRNLRRVIMASTAVWLFLHATFMVQIAYTKWWPAAILLSAFSAAWWTLWLWVNEG